MFNKLDNKAPPAVHGLTLSETENRIFARFDEAGLNHDVPIRSIYHAMFQVWPEDHISTRRQQQLVGAYITRLNRKLKHQRLKVGLGVARRSYRLIPISKIVN